jgi:hypothetical protein
MGSRRLGRRRLYSLNKAGQSLSKTNGAGAPVVSKTNVRREGDRIITTIAVDLGSSLATALKKKNGAAKVIGDDGVTGAYIAELSLANNGYIVYAEMVCLEQPTADAQDIDLYVNNSVLNYDGDASSGGTQILECNGNLDVGSHVASAVTLKDFGAPDADKYLYLAAGVAGSGVVTYAAGKLLIMLEGIASDAVASI